MKIELLAPAGNLEKLKIAINYGADAVYLAGQHFGLRSAATNFSNFEIREAIQYAHERGRKVYITLNAYLHSEELEHLPEFVKFLADVQPDGVICSDLGVMETVKKCSNLPLHISTQTSTLNSQYANIWKSLGAKRIVVGRELSILETAEIKKNTGLEVEMFVHGAMCMSHSGYCSLSTYIAGRDSNRGGCIQNCRYNYKFSPLDVSGSKENTHFFMSSKDLCGFSMLETFMKRGIDSLKVEGRMKSNLYIASVIRAYARVIRELERGETPDFSYWEHELTKIPHRDYTDASMKEPAGMDSVYAGKKETPCDFELAGTVLEVNEKEGVIFFQAKNKLSAGSEIEILSYQGEAIVIKLDDLQNIKGKALEAIQPKGIIRLPWRKGIEVHNVARVDRSRFPR